MTNTGMTAVFYVLRFDNSYRPLQDLLHTVAMTRLEYAIAIETNRTKLLCIVRCWLIFASFISRSKRELPLRLSRWVGTLLFKIEAATGLLIIAVARLHARSVDPQNVFVIAARTFQNGLFDADDIGCLSVAHIVARLKAVHAALRELDARNIRHPIWGATRPDLRKPLSSLGTAGVPVAAFGARDCSGMSPLPP